VSVSFPIQNTKITVGTNTKNFSPAASYWEVTIKSEYCVNPAVFNIVTGVVNSMTDFVVYLWPVQFLWGIQIPLKQKLGVIFLFVIGIW
jgi:hypothetical protein